MISEKAKKIADERLKQIRERDEEARFANMHMICTDCAGELNKRGWELNCPKCNKTYLCTRSWNVLYD
jgi:hypothetical protein